MRFQNKNWILPPHIIAFLKEDAWYECKEVEDTRTLAQNRILFWYYYEECLQAFKLKWIILNKDQVHFFFKTLIPKKRKKCKVTWRYRTEEVSTTKLSKKEFSKYIEAIKQWCWDNLEYSIQEPTQEQELLYYQNQMNYGTL